MANYLDGLDPKNRAGGGRSSVAGLELARLETRPACRPARFLANARVKMRDPWTWERRFSRTKSIVV
jgi:hypothetical protein